MTLIPSFVQSKKLLRRQFQFLLLDNLRITRRIIRGIPCNCKELRFSHVNALALLRSLKMTANCTVRTF